LRGRFGDGRLVVLRCPEVAQNDCVVEIARKLLDARDLLLDGCALSRDRLRLFLVVPKPGRERLLLEPVDLGLQLGKVKDAPLAP
jgi:hypothetical protein